MVSAKTVVAPGLRQLTLTLSTLGTVLSDREKRPAPPGVPGLGICGAWFYEPPQSRYIFESAKEPVLTIDIG